MRWLAYGGTKLEVRHQTGSWDIRPDALWQESGLAENGRLSFGAGELDGEAVLVVRQLQKDHVGRDKAYTLLLMPPQDIWEKVGWNAAALAWQLFEAPGSAGVWLLDEPELEHTHPGRALATLRAAARAWAGPVDEAGGEVLGRLLAAGWMETSLVEAPLAACLGEGNISAARLAACLDWLPPCFRIGWLTGGNASLAEALGIPLLLHDGGGHDNRAVMEPRGARLLEGWRSAAESSSAIQLRSGLPACLWEAAGLGDPGSGIAAAGWLAMLEGEEALATALKASPLRLETLPQDARQEVRTGLVSVLLASASPAQITESHVQMILEAVCSSALPSSVSVPPGLIHAGQVSGFLESHGLSPADLPTGLLEVGLIRQLWKQVVLESGSLEVALCHLQKLTSSPENLSAVAPVADFFAQALRHWHLAGSLRQWLPVIRQVPDLETRLRPVLAELAVERLLADLSGSRRDYLLLAEDRAAASLAHAPAARQQKALTDVQNLALEIVESQELPPPEPALASAAVRWFSGLQESEWRQRMDIRVKLRAARHGGWEHFLLLEELLLGESGLAQHPTRPPPAEKKHLAAEAPALAALRAAGMPPPDLYMLETLCGPEVLGKVVREVTARCPDLTGQAGNQWIKSLWEKELDETAVKEQTRRVMSEACEAELVDHWLCCDKRLMVYSLEKLLLHASEGAERPVARALAAAVAIIDCRKASSTLGAGCRDLLKRLARSPNPRAHFIQRLWDHDPEIFWAWLCQAANDTQPDLVAAWVEQKPQELKKLIQAENELRRLSPGSTRLYAPLWRFLRQHGDGPSWQTKLGKAFRKPPPGWESSRPAYRAILDESQLRQTESSEDEPEPARKGFWQRLWRWL